MDTGIFTVEELANIGLITMRYIDRIGDPHPGIDNIEDICSEFYTAVSTYTASIFNRGMK
jgi:hypothetical protein